MKLFNLGISFVILSVLILTGCASRTGRLSTDDINAGAAASGELTIYASDIAKSLAAEDYCSALLKSKQAREKFGDDKQFADLGASLLIQRAAALAGVLSMDAENLPNTIAEQARVNDDRAAAVASAAVEPPVDPILICDLFKSIDCDGLSSADISLEAYNIVADIMKNYPSIVKKFAKDYPIADSLARATYRAENKWRNPEAATGATATAVSLKGGAVQARIAGKAIIANEMYRAKTTFSEECYSKAETRFLEHLKEIETSLKECKLTVAEFISQLAKIVVDLTSYKSFCPIISSDSGPQILLLANGQVYGFMNMEDFKADQANRDSVADNMVSYVNKETKRLVGAIYFEPGVASDAKTFNRLLLSTKTKITLPAPQLIEGGLSLDQVAASLKKAAGSVKGPAFILLMNSSDSVYDLVNFLYADSTWSRTVNLRFGDTPSTSIEPNNDYEPIDVTSDNGSAVPIYIDLSGYQVHLWFSRPWYGSNYDSWFNAPSGYVFDYLYPGYGTTTIYIDFYNSSNGALVGSSTLPVNINVSY